MTKHGVKKALRTNVGKLVSAATRDLWTIGIELRAPESAADKTAISMEQGWKIMQNGKQLLILDEDGCFRPEFDLDSDWTEYEAEENRVAEIILQLVGQSLESISCSKDLLELELKFSNGFVLMRDIDNSKWAKWTYENPKCALHFEVSFAGLEDFNRMPKDALARRHIIFRKDGKELPGTVVVMLPRASGSDPTSTEVLTVATIQTPFENSKISVAGVDGIQSTRLCFVRLQEELDRIADTNFAEVYHLAPEVAAFHRPENEFDLVHSLLASILENISADSPPSATSEHSNLERLRNCVRRVERIRTFRTAK